MVLLGLGPPSRRVPRVVPVAGVLSRGLVDQGDGVPERTLHLRVAAGYLPAAVMLATFSLPLFLVDLFLEARDQEYPFVRAHYAVRTGFAAAALLLWLFAGNELNAFIYFQF